MSKKVLTSMKDENSDLQKQIGCISGFFQLFDRHRFLTDQTSGSHSQKTQNRPISGSGGTSNHIKEQNSTKQKPLAKNVMVARENQQQFSTESSVTSMSSSSCSSSMSSLEFNRTIQIEPPSIIQIKVPENSNSAAAMKQLGTPDHQSLDFYDIVKDSMQREAKGLSVKTMPKDEKKGRVLKHTDSPRPLQPLKSVNKGAIVTNEPFHILAKSHAPWDSPRLSYDERNTQHTFKSATKHKELPRLSLDSRERSIKGINEGTKSNNLLKGPQKGYVVKQLQESETSKRPSSVVAKLMGLEAFAGLTQTCDTPMRSSVSPRTSNDNTVLESRSDASITNVKSYSQSSLESKGSESSIKASNPYLSVYGEIEKRMADLEFKNSGKDLRALKQILDAMQRYKDSLDIARDQASNSSSDNRNNSSCSERSTVQITRIRQKDPTSVTAEKSNSTKGSKLPIVIMKQAKVTRQTNNHNAASTEMQIHGKSGKFVPGSHTNERMFDKLNRQKAKGIGPTSRHHKDPFSQPFQSADKGNKMGTSKLLQSSKVPQVINRESTTNSSNTAETRSPRLQKKFGLERPSPPTSPSSYSSTNRRQHNRQSLEVTSPSSTPRQKFSAMQERNEDFSDSSCQRRDFKHEVDVISPDFDSNRSMDSHSEIEVIHVDHSEKNDRTSIHQNGLHQNNATKELSKESFMSETIVAAEQPSPVSVLDAAFYIEDPPSPVKKKSHISKDLDEALNSYDSSEENTEDLPLSSNTRKSNFSSGTGDIDTKTQNLVQILQQKLNNFSDSKDPDHKYISQILLASGLLSSPGSSQAFHSSSHPISPKLFLALEQIRTNKMHFKIEHSVKKIAKINNPEQMQRKLIFDVVNDILVEKLILESSSIMWCLPNKPAGRRLKGKLLLDELCTEIDQLQHKNGNANLANEDEYLTSLLWGDLMHQPTILTESYREIPNIVLDIERLIFKDLITEVVSGEVANHPGRHCRQLLFPK